MKKKGLSHAGPDGRARMVDLSGKEETDRYARAEAVVRLGPEAARLLADTGSAGKGDPLETARIAGVMTAKRTPEWIPLCHPIPLDHVDLEARLDGERVRIVCAVSCRARTGVEMEAMTGAAAAALTVYDMCKSAGKGIVIETVRLLEKRGGKSGDWTAEAD